MPIIKEDNTGFFKKERMTSEFLRGEKGEAGSAGEAGDKGATGDSGEKGDSGALGHSGEKGDSGALGHSGDKGNSGALGYSGDRGNSGAVGNKGALGNSGPVGDKGLVGDKGALGNSGPVGDSGTKGHSGAIGDKGGIGDKGAVGNKGALGNSGPVGDSGTKGHSGAIGDKGGVGDKGGIGDKGAVGNKGALGNSGPIGDKGGVGDKGSVGDKGALGNSGAQGDQGDKGIEGNAASNGSFEFFYGGFSIAARPQGWTARSVSATEPPEHDTSPTWASAMIDSSGNLSQAGLRAIKLESGSASSVDKSFLCTQVNEGYSDAARIPLGYSTGANSEKWQFSAWVKGTTGGGTDRVVASLTMFDKSGDYLGALQLFSESSITTSYVQYFADNLIDPADLNSGTRFCGIQIERTSGVLYIDSVSLRVSKENKEVFARGTFDNNKGGTTNQFGLDTYMSQLSPDGGTYGGMVLTNGPFTVGSSGQSGGLGATAGAMYASNDVVAFSSSDSRLKENIKTITGALDAIQQLNGVEFDWKPDIEKVSPWKGHDMGLIAQEVEKIFPYLVQTRDSGYKALHYERLVALLIEGIKELAKWSHEPQNFRGECEELKERILQLEQKVEDLSDGRT